MHSNRRFRKDSVPPESSHPRCAPYPVHSLPIHTAPRLLQDMKMIPYLVGTNPEIPYTRPTNTNREQGAWMNAYDGVYYIRTWKQPRSPEDSHQAEQKTTGFPTDRQCDSLQDQAAAIRTQRPNAAAPLQSAACRLAAMVHGTDFLHRIARRSAATHYEPCRRTRISPRETALPRNRLESDSRQEDDGMVSAAGGRAEDRQRPSCGGRLVNSAMSSGDNPGTYPRIFLQDTPPRAISANGTG